MQKENNARFSEALQYLTLISLCAGMCGSSCCWHLLCCVFFCSSVSSECWSRAECLHATACTSWAAPVPWAEMLRALWNGVKGRNGRGSLIQLAFPAGALTDVTTILVDLIQPSLEIFGLIQTYKSTDNYHRDERKPISTIWAATLETFPTLLLFSFLFKSSLLSSGCFTSPV